MRAIKYNKSDEEESELVKSKFPILRFAVAKQPIRLESGLKNMICSSFL